MQGGIGFILLGGLFVGSLLKALWNMFTTDWDQEKFTGMSILNLLKIPLISLVLLILFIIYLLPHLDQ